MFPPPQFPGQGPSSPGAPRVPPGPPGNHPVNLPTSSSSTPPPQPPSGAPGRHPISLPTKRFQPPAEPRKTDVAGIADLPPLPELSYDEYDAAEESDDSSDLGGAEGKPPISLKQTEFSLKQFAKRMGQANYSAFNKWKKVWVAGFLEKKHRSIIRGQNRLKQVRDGPLHWETAVADFLATFETWLPLVNFDNAEWIRRQWVEMFLKKCASEIREARKKGRRGNKRPATDLGERPGKKARSNLPELPNTTFTVMISWVSNGKDMVLAPKQLQASYTDVRHWEELVDFIDKNGGPKEPYVLKSMFKCTLEQDELEEEYMGIYKHGQMINDPIYGQISYNCCLSNAFKLKLGHNLKIFVLEMKRATGKEIAEHVIRPTKVIPLAVLRLDVSNC
jgi:hypothetical protein